MSATPEQRLLMAVFQTACLRCEQDFDTIDGTTIVDGLLLHTACLTADDREPRDYCPLCSSENIETSGIGADHTLHCTDCDYVA